MAKFKYLEITILNEVCFTKKLRADEIRGIILTVHLKISSFLLPKNLQVETYRAVILSVVLHECEA
jgi:hypothetical protein